MHTYTGVSGDIVPHNRDVTAALMGTPAKERAPWHGGCAEIVCLDNALNDGVSVKGASVKAVNIGISGDGHNTSKPLCSSCQSVLKFFGVNVENE